MVREVKQCPEDGGRHRVGTGGVDADVGQPDGAPLIGKSRRVPQQYPTGSEKLEGNDGRRERQFGAEEGPRGAPPRFKVVRDVCVYPRECHLATVRDLGPGPLRGSWRQEARAGRRGAAEILRLVPSNEVTGEAALVVAGRPQWDRRGALRIRHVDEWRTRQDEVAGRHQRRVGRGGGQGGGCGRLLSRAPGRTPLLRGRCETVKRRGGCVAVRSPTVGRGLAPQLWTAHPLGLSHNIPIRASKGMACLDLGEIGFGLGWGFFPVVFPTPLLLL